VVRVAHRGDLSQAEVAAGTTEPRVTRPRYHGLNPLIDRPPSQRPEAGGHTMATFAPGNDD
jgi:hypothetical protein